jgi:hypothetical protein
MTPASDSCGSQGIRTVLSPSGYIGPSPPATGLGPPSSAHQLVSGRRPQCRFRNAGSGLLSSSSADEDSPSTDSDDPWSCLLVFRLAVGQQLNVSLLDFTAAARAEFSAQIDGESGTMDSAAAAAEEVQHADGTHDQLEQHRSRSHEVAPRDKQVRNQSANIVHVYSIPYVS